MAADPLEAFRPTIAKIQELLAGRPTIAEIAEADKLILTILDEAETNLRRIAEETAAEVLGPDWRAPR